MSKRTAAPFASVNVPRTNCRYSQHVHLHLRPWALKAAATSKDSLLAVGSVLGLSGACSRLTQQPGLRIGGTMRCKIGGRVPGALGKDPPGFGSRPRQPVGEYVCDSGNVFWSPSRVTTRSVGAFTPCPKVYSARACSTRIARTGSGPGSGLAIGSKLPSTGLSSSTTRSSRFATCGGGGCAMATSIASETEWMPGTLSTVGVTTSPERRCGRRVGMAPPFVWRGEGFLRNLPRGGADVEPQYSSAV